MNYDALRQFADSWGLVAMGVMFIAFVGWTFVPAVRRGHQRAATSILENEELIDG